MEGGQVHVADEQTGKHGRTLAECLCAFCHEGEDSDDPDEDPLVPVETGRTKQHYAHQECLMWCPDLYQAEDMTWLNVGTSLRRCHRLKCAGCGEGDAPLGCKRVACRKNWHHPCAMERAATTGLKIYEDEYCVACMGCHLLLERRALKKKLLAEEKAKEKAIKRAEKQRVSSATPAKGETSSMLSPATGPGPKAKPKAGASKLSRPVASMPPPPAVPVARAPATAAPKSAAPKSASVVPLRAPASAPMSAAKAVAVHVPAASAAPPLGFDYHAAQEAISRLFSKERTEDLPLDKLRAAAQLSDEHFKVLLARLDADNKVMAHAGTAYLI